MRDLDLNNLLLQRANILHGERMLIVDNNLSLIDMLKNKKLELSTVFCDSRDFRSITSYPDDYMNAFDIIICPEVIYSIKTVDRQKILECLVWSMKPMSRIIFAIPNIKRYTINKTMEINNESCVLKEKDMYYELSQKKYIFFSSSKEYWHKTTLRFPSQVFSVWNSSNPNSQWDLENSAVSESEWNFIYSIDMKKFNVRNRDSE